VSGAIVVVLSVSFAALVFTGPLERHLQAGIGLSLFGSVIVLLVLAATSSFAATIGSVQDTTAAILGIVAAGVAAAVPAERDFLDVVLAIALTSAFTGVFFLALGSLKLGNLVRYVPYPVIGGFLAGTGLLLLKGGFGIVSDVPFSLGTLGEFVEPDVAVRWLPGLALGVVLLIALRRSHRALVLPAVLGLAIVIFYGVLLVTGTSLTEARAEGWLLGPYPAGALWRPWAWEALGDASWGSILAQAGGMATVLLVGVISLLLNVSGVELATGRDIDLNRELRATGAANVALGLGGGMVGFHALALSVLSHRLGVRDRLTGFLAAAVVAVALLVGTSIVTFVPTVVVGGLVLFLGLSFLVEWVFDAWFRLPRTDYAVAMLILLAIAFFGFLVGVGLGLVLAVVLFVYDYSRTDTVKHSMSGGEIRSKVDRSELELELLASEGGRLHVFELHGVVFFGTANSLLDRIRERIRHDSLTPLRALILDFRRVNGIDSSAVLAFMKVEQLAESAGFDLLLTGVPPRMRRQLEKGGLTENTGRLAYVEDLDRGLQLCEEKLLEDARVTPVQREPFWTRLAAELGDDAGRLRDYLEPVDVPRGHVLIRQGDLPEDLFLLEDGVLTAQMGDDDGSEVRLRTMGPGTVVGEIGMYTGGLRTASIVAEAPSRVLRLHRDSLETMERDDPALAFALHRMLAKSLASRLTDTLRTIDALLD
jgi:sulfate permease, SulP family